jgi:hypothetical protein
MAKIKREKSEEVEDTEEVDSEDDEEFIDEEDIPPLVRSPEFFKAYATRTVPYLTEYDIRVVVANETMGDDEGWCTVADGMIIMTPLAAKELLNELEALISTWEELHGKIRERKGRRIVTTFSREEG